MEQEYIIVNNVGGIAYVTLNDPDRRNALGYELGWGLADKRAETSAAAVT